MTLNPNEVRVGADGLVQPTHGVSLDTNPATLERFGGAQRADTIPAELQTIQRGSRLTRYKIVPKSPMTIDKFQKLLKEVKLK